MESITYALLLFSFITGCLSDNLQYEISSQDEGSGFSESSGEFLGEFLQEDYDYHEVKDLDSLDSQGGRSEVTDMKDVVGTQYLISRPVDEREITEERDKDNYCNCHCYAELTYQHENSVNTKEIDFILQDQDKETTLCSEEKYMRCCKDFRSQARFRFPDSDPLLPEISVSESVLVLETNKSPAQPSVPETTERVRTPSDWDVFTSLEEGSDLQELEQTIPSMAHWFVLLELSGPARVSLKLSSRTAVAFLLRKSERPTLAKFDILDILDGSRMMVKMFSLTGGAWYLRLSNEEPDSVEMLLTVTVEAEPDLVLDLPDCPLVHGELSCRGRCHHGILRQGEGCVCLPGWVGAQCNVTQADCSSQLCSSQGQCEEGQGGGLSCLCDPGYQGPACLSPRCPLDCAGNGACDNGSCRCFSGWEGLSCNTTSTNTIEVICPDSFLAEEPVSVECEAGWAGEDCSTKLCDPRCSLHGECLLGECVCQPGWSGAHCTLDGCPRACSGHGTCSKEGERWSCSCQPSWTGSDCSVQLETMCSDGLDNDDGETTISNMNKVTQ